MTSQLSQNLECANCLTSIDPPGHCGRAMQFADGYWVCWKGEHEACCGRSAKVEFENCCDNPEIIDSNKNAFA